MKSFAGDVVFMICRNLDMEKAMADKELERDLLTYSRQFYEQKTLPGLYFSQNIGNMYTPSLYYSLFSFLSG